ncbi:MAG: Crp/Fnr family transcriptional regulator [Granulosicoccus sp.]
MSRPDISLFYAARKSALDDRSLKGYSKKGLYGSTANEALDNTCLTTVKKYRSSNRKLPAGTSLYLEQDVCKEIYIVLDGWVSMNRSVESGRQLILNFLLPGAFLGFQSDLLAPTDYAVKCVTDTVVCVFPRSTFVTLLDENPDLAVSLRLGKAEQEKIMQDNLINIATRPARARLAYFMLNLHARVVQAYPEQSLTDIHIPITQQNIADSLGLSNVHVNRAIRTLHKENILSLKRSRLQIHDFDKLAEIAAHSETLTV